MKIGVLSDTHLRWPNERFQEMVLHAFGDCQIIIHAGDLVSHEIRSVFGDKQIYAVHGNCCTPPTKACLPDTIETEIDGYHFCITHGSGNRMDIEDRVFSMFPFADCIVYGHSHLPSIRKIGQTLLVNPGSFQSTGRWGSPGTYATIITSKSGLTATISELGRHR